MKIMFGKLSIPKKGALVLGISENRKMLPLAEEVNRMSGGLLKSAMEMSKFDGRSHQTLTVFLSTGRVLLYGLGRGDEIDPLWCEKAGGSIVGLLSKTGESSVSVIFEFPENHSKDFPALAAHLGYGAQLRSYRFDKYRTNLKEDEKHHLNRVQILIDGYNKSRRYFGRLAAIAEGVFLARDLVSEPPNVLFPESYAKRLELLRQEGIKVEVFGEKAMSRLKMGALLGVGQGSSRESKLVVMQWNGGKVGEKPLAFIGKGVCFDTGGISLKPASSMEDMKWDMGGSAVVAGLMKSLAKSKAKVNAVGVVGLVENMPDGNAQRPGDVVTSMSGKTIEIINTDAEGRLVLADVLWYVKRRFKPKFMIDLATLTGAMLVSLGQVNCGYFANDDQLSDQLDKAAKIVGEGVWRMPLGEDYNKMMDSDIADMKNAGPRYGGSITAACFLERFVDTCPWSHMDIAGVTWSSKDAATVPKGGTGWGVRTLHQLVREFYE